MSQPIFPNAEEMDAIAEMFPLATRRRVARMTFPMRGAGKRPTGETLCSGHRAKHCGCVNDALLVHSGRTTAELLQSKGRPLTYRIMEALGLSDEWARGSVKEAAVQRLITLNDDGHLTTTAAVRRALLRPGE